jgi:glycosyltransferase involved in cell wall biosynthesis
MKRVVFDARESGTSSGRYVDKLLENMHTLKPGYEMVLLVKPHRVDFMKQIAPSFKTIETGFKEFTFGEQLGFKKQIESLKPDLVHFPMVQQPVWYRGRVVTTMQDLTTIRFKNPSKNPVVFWVKQQVYKWVNKRVAHKSDHILSISEFVKRDVAQYTGISLSKMTVTYNAADKIPDKPEPISTLEDKKFIMYLGRPLPHKNLDRLMQAFAKLKAKHPELILVLAGKKDVLFERHEKYAQENGIKDVVFTGFVSEGQLRWLYENTACYVFPSLSEGFGLPGLEAMMHGAPVASSNATCLPEVYGDAAAYFDPLNVDDMAAVVEKIITDESQANKLRTLGREQVKKYSWRRSAEMTLEVYGQVLGEKWEE